MRCALPVFLLCLSSSSLLAQTRLPRSQFTPTDRAVFLRLHNSERREVGAPPLKWDHKLAAYAQAHANRLAETGEFVHMSRELRRKLDHGENIFWGSRKDPRYHAERCSKSWASEKFDKKTGKSIFVKGTIYNNYKKKYPGKVIGHWTQMIWRSTTKVGAGIARIKKGKYKGGYVVVARYNPRGNRGSRAP